MSIYLGRIIGGLEHVDVRSLTPCELAPGGKYLRVYTTATTASLPDPDEMNEEAIEVMHKHKLDPDKYQRIQHTSIWAHEDVTEDENAKIRPALMSDEHEEYESPTPKVLYKQLCMWEEVVSLATRLHVEILPAAEGFVIVRGNAYKRVWAGAVTLPELKAILVKRVHKANEEWSV